MRFLLLFFLCFITVVAQAQPNLLKNGDFAQDLAEWDVFYLPPHDPPIGTVTPIDAQGTPFRRAVRVVVKPQPDDTAFALGMKSLNTQPLHQNDDVHVKVWMRSPDSIKTTIRLEENKEPWTGWAEKEVALTPQWQEYDLRGQSPRDFAAQEAIVSFWFAHGKGTIEVGGVRLLDSPRPELDLQFGHGGGVDCVAYSPDGKTIATGGKDSTVKFWSAATGQLIRTIRVRADASTVLDLVFSPDGKTIATGCQDAQVDLWNVQTGAREKVFNNSSGWESAIAFSPDGRLLACLSWNPDRKTQSIYLRDVQTGEVRRTLADSGDILGLEFSPDGRLVAAGGRDEKVRVWDATTGELKHTLLTPGEGVYDVGFSPDGKIIASASENGPVRTLRFWDARSGNVVRAITPPGNVRTFAFSPDGKTIAGGGEGVHLWNAATGEYLQKFAAVQSLVGEVAFSPDGQTLAAGTRDTTTELWDVRTGKKQKTLGFNAVVRAAIVSPDGSTLVSSHGDDTVRLWDLHTGELQKTIAAPGVQSLVFLGEGGRIATGSHYGTVQVWDVTSGKMLQKWDDTPLPVHAMTLSPDGKILASGGDEDVIKLWDSSSGALLRSFSAGSHIFSLAFSPDGGVLACGTEGQQVKLLDAKNGTVLRTLGGYVWVISSLAFSPDGKLLGTACWDGSLKMWDVATGQLLWTRKDLIGGNRPLKFSVDGRSLNCGLAGRISVIDAQTGQESRSLLSGGGNIQTLCFSPDERTIITGGEDSIKLWDNASGRILASIVALPPQDSLEGAKPLTADAKALTADAKALTADARPLTAEAREVATSGDFLVVTSDGYYSGSATVDRYIHFKLADDSFPAECFQSRYYRPDLVKLALSGAAVPSAGDFKGAYPPLAAFADGGGGVVTGNTATVTLATSDDSAIQKVAFLVNGSRVEAKETATQSRPLTADAKALTADARPLTADVKVVPSAHTMTRNFTATLPIPADAESVKVQAIAFDEDGLQSPRAEMTLYHAKIATTTGKLLGLCVGVSRYQDARLNLKYADADATALAGDFNKQTTLYRPTQVKALVNEQATAPAVTAALDSLIGQVTSVDTVIVSLSGHGWRDESGKFYFATTEVNRNDVAHSALSWDEVVGRLTRLSQKSKRVIVLLDACHSGSAATNEEMVKAILGANAGVLVFASSRGSEVSLENAEWAHGAFTKALLEAAQGLAATGDDKNLTTIDFIAYVSRRVKTLTENQQHPQVPFLQDFDTDAPIVAKE